MGLVPVQFGKLSVLDSFALPTAPSIPFKVDGKVVPGIDEKVSYVLVEFACSKDSKLSSDRYGRHNSKLVVRILLTEDHDMTSESGLQYALSMVDLFLGRVPVFAGVACPVPRVHLGNS